MKARSRHSRDLVFLLCLASLVHLGLWVYGQNSPSVRRTNDSRDYIRSAANLLDRGTLYSGNLDREIRPSLYSKRTPLYPLFIASLRPISRNPGIIAFAQVLLNLLAAYLMWEILCYFEVVRSLKILVIAFYLFYPAQLIYTHLVMAEVLLQLMLLSSFYFLVQFHKSKKWHYLGLCNLFLGLAALTKPIMVYFWIPNLLYQAWLLWQIRRRSLIFLSLIPLLFVTIWCYRNYLHTDYFHFSSIKTSNMLHVNIHGMVHRAGGERKSIDVTRDIEQKARNAESFAEASRTVERAFIETMLKNWPSMIRLYARSSIFFFLDPGRFDLYEFLDLPHDFRTYHLLKAGIANAPQILAELPPFVLPYFFLVGSMNILLLAGFIYWTYIRRCPLELKLFVLTLMSYTLLVVVQSALSRFRLSVMPFLFLALPPLLERFISIWRARKTKLLH